SCKNSAGENSICHDGSMPDPPTTKRVRTPDLDRIVCKERSPGKAGTPWLRLFSCCACSRFPAGWNTKPAETDRCTPMRWHRNVATAAPALSAASIANLGPPVTCDVRQLDPERSRHNGSLDYRS